MAESGAIERVSKLSILPLAGGVIGLVAKEQEIPPGGAGHERVTEVEYEFNDPDVHVVFVFVPLVALTAAGVQSKENSGALVTCKLPLDAWLKLPFVPMT